MNMGRLKNQPFTLPGFVFLAIVLVILIRSLAAQNAYEIVLSLAALALLLVLWLVGRWAVRRMEALEPLWKIPLPQRAAPIGAASCEDWLVGCPMDNVPKFFRLHFRVRGRFFPQGISEGCPVFAETSLSKKSDDAGSNNAKISLCFPLGGLFQGETSCRLRDIFGFFSFPCGNSRERSLRIRSAPCNALELRIDAQSGAEDRRNKNASDEERYYMREYAPGDRFRDINWKSSERINTLITRISPDNQEKITRIEVRFRNYAPLINGAPAIADLWLLDRAKARLAWFLRKVKEEKASYVFHVQSAGASWDLNDEGDIEAFLEELSAIPFAPVQNEAVTEPQSDGEIYIFSTACDTALPAFLLAQQGRRPYSLFLTQNAPRAKESGAPRQAPHLTPPQAPPHAPDVESLFLRDFPAAGFAPLPRWLLPQRGRQLKVSGDRMMIDYAETRL